MMYVRGNQEKKLTFCVYFLRNSYKLIRLTLCFERLFCETLSNEHLRQSMLSRFACCRQVKYILREIDEALRENINCDIDSPKQIDRYDFGFSS